MMALGLSARDTRTLLIGFVVVGALWGGARGVPALLARERARRDAALATLAQVAADRAALRLASVHRDSLRARVIRLAALDSVMLSGGSAAAAVAQLASVLDDVADEQQIRTTTVQLRADTGTVNGLARVALRMTGVADVAGLAGLLRSVEGDDMPLVVRELSVSQTEPAAAESKPEALRFDVLVEGIARTKPVERP